MKLTIFGATGRTGIHLVPQALELGHNVTALVRTMSKLTIDDDRLAIIEGDVSDAVRVEEAVKNAEAVLSVLGPTSNKPEYPVSRGMRHIIDAMNNHGVRRLVASTGAGVADTHDVPKIFNKLMGLMVRTFSRYVYEDMVRSVDLIRASDLDWTIVRVPMLTDEPATGNVKAAYVGKGIGSRLSRADLAAFMLQQVEDETYLRQAPAISN